MIRAVDLLHKIRRDRMIRREVAIQRMQLPGYVFREIVDEVCRESGPMAIDVAFNGTGADTGGPTAQLAGILLVSMDEQWIPNTRTEREFCRQYWGMGFGD